MAQDRFLRAAANRTPPAAAPVPMLPVRIQGQIPQPSPSLVSLVLPAALASDCPLPAGASLGVGDAVDFGFDEVLGFDARGGLLVGALGVCGCGLDDVSPDVSGVLGVTDPRGSGFGASAPPLVAGAPGFDEASLDGARFTDGAAGRLADGISAAGFVVLALVAGSLTSGLGVGAACFLLPGLGVCCAPGTTG